MEALENAQLALSRVQFIAEIELVADCNKKDLQTALATISHLVEVELKTHGLVSQTTVYETKN